MSSTTLASDSGKATESEDCPTPSTDNNSPADASERFLNINSIVVDEFPRRRSRTKRDTSSRLWNAPAQIIIESLPSISETAEADQLDLVLKKLEQCHVVFDFTDPLADIRCKEIKREALKELLAYFEKWKSPAVFPDSLYRKVAEMFVANADRPYIGTASPSLAEDYPEEDEEEQENLECAWPHLSIIYDILHTFVQSSSFEPKHAYRFFDAKFILKLIQLLNSEDRRERTSVKMVLHKLYAKFVNLRSYTRKEMSYVLISVAYDNTPFNGICEILEIEKCIISGFQIPLKPEHRIFFRKALLPLRRATSIFGQQRCSLNDCVLEFIAKDNSLVYEVLDDSFRKWNSMLPVQQLSMLDDVEGLLGSLEHSALLAYLPKLTKNVSMAIASSHFQVCERSLAIAGGYIIPFISRKSDDMFIRHLYPPIYRHATCHWRLPTQLICRQAVECLEKTNRRGCLEVRQSMSDDRDKKCQWHAEHEQLWKALEALKINPESVNQPFFSSSSLLEMEPNDSEEDEVQRKKSTERYPDKSARSKSSESVASPTDAKTNGQENEAVKRSTGN